MENLNLDDIPGKVLKNSTKILLALYLNPKQDILSPKGYARDFRGLIDQLNLDHNVSRNFQGKDNPTLEILNTWIDMPNTTIGELVKYLENMDRHDVVQEFLSHFASCYLTGPSLHGSDILADTESNSRFASSCYTVPNLIDFNSMVGESATINTASNSLNDSNILTERESNTAQTSTSFMNGLNDSEFPIKQEPITKKIDAFFCYADEDREFVYGVVAYLESKGYKCFIRDRDMVAGHHSEHGKCLQLIEENSKLTFAVFSNNFLESPQYEAQADFAAETGIMERRSNLVPIVYKPCKIPRMFRFYSKIDFTKNSLESQLESIIKSIRGDHSPSLLPLED